MKSMALVLVLLCSSAFAADQSEEVLLLKAEVSMLKLAVPRLRNDVKTIKKTDIAELRENQTRILATLDRIDERLKILEDAATGGDAPASGTASTAVAKPSPTRKGLLALRAWDFHVQKKKGFLGEQLQYRVELSLHNGYPKGIKLIEARIHFSDLLENHLLGIKIDPDLHIPAGETVKESGLYGVNQFIDAQRRMARIDRKDIKAELRIDRVVFEDNTILKF